jgi:hypothetical protein
VINIFSSIFFLLPSKLQDGLEMSNKMGKHCIWFVISLLEFISGWQLRRGTISRRGFLVLIFFLFFLVNFSNIVLHNFLVESRSSKIFTSTHEIPINTLV